MERRREGEGEKERGEGEEGRETKRKAPRCVRGEERRGEVESFACNFSMSYSYCTLLISFSVLSLSLLLFFVAGTAHFMFVVTLQTNCTAVAKARR